MSDIKEEVKAKSDIVAIAEGYGLELKKRNETHQALCPFHEESTPSFAIYPQTNSFHCFGCGKGGDVIRFVELMEGIEFREALSILAEKAGLDTGKREKEEPLSALERLFHDVYAKGRAELFGDGIEAKEVREFLETEKGFAKSDLEKVDLCVFTPALRKHVKESYPRETVDLSGLCRWGFGFNYTLLIPHHDMKGRIAGMIARLIKPGIYPRMKEELPKYNNSPGLNRDIPFNIHKASPKIRRTSEAFQVEGPLDVYSMVINGFENSIGALGRNISERYLNLLNSTGVRNIFLVADNDAPGLESTEKMVKGYLKTRWGLPFFVEIASDNVKDPNDFFNPARGGKGPDDFRLLISQAVSGPKWLAKRMTGRIDGDAARFKSIEEAGKVYLNIADPICRNEFLRAYSRAVKITMAELFARYGAPKYPGRKKYGNESEEENEGLKAFLASMKQMCDEKSDVYLIQKAAEKALGNAGRKKVAKPLKDAARTILTLAGRYEIAKLEQYVEDSLKRLQGEGA